MVRGDKSGVNLGGVGQMLGNIYVRDGISVVLELTFYRLYFDQVDVNKSCCLFSNAGEWYGVIGEHKKPMKSRIYV